MSKDEEFEKIANKLDEISCQAFALWYMFPVLEGILRKQIHPMSDDVQSYLASAKAKELLKSAEEIKEVLSHELW